MPKQAEVKERIGEVLEEMLRLLENMRAYHTRQFPQIYNLIDEVKKLEKITNGEK